ncbi:DUF6542 domain-containing protein [Mycobacterium haemophilum]|uniref:DUF6542 domain-containing protein n=1 Tax=Mycobacterium haemophilum TaxID=29311 RepID=UPI0006561D77|nr:DUF6542 domain-containing protein [Mycobacterium haemophilum]MCV7342145.1 hypothetical protein [Mycobacterium haemophilum DSM 44634]
MSTQRARSTVEPTHRSILPNIPGVPWWAALLIATAASAIGYAIDAGNTDLTAVFAGFYFTGCVAAVLAVRQSGLFTAVIQPPLILFCAVPGAYWLFHGGKIGSLKDLLINCGYPLIERFPLMLGTAGSVLLIGLARWFFGLTHRTTASSNSDDDTAGTVSKPNSLISGITAVLNSILRIDSNDQDYRADEDSAGSQRMHSDRPPRTRRAAREGRSAQRPTRTHSRHARRPVEDTGDPSVEPRRHSSRRGSAQARDFDADQPPRRSRRRPPPPSARELHGQPPREIRRDAYGRRSSPYERPASRSSRLEPYGRYEQPGPPEHFTGYGQPPYERYEQPRRRATPPGAGGVNPTHHPISQVRYRGSAARDEPRADRRRSQAPRRPAAESWEFDV